MFVFIRSALGAMTCVGSLRNPKGSSGSSLPNRLPVGCFEPNKNPAMSNRNGTFPKIFSIAGSCLSPLKSNASSKSARNSPTCIGLSNGFSAAPTERSMVSPEPSPTISLLTAVTISCCCAVSASLEILESAASNSSPFAPLPKEDNAPPRTRPALAEYKTSYGSLTAFWLTM